VQEMRRGTLVCQALPAAHLQWMSAAHLRMLLVSLSFLTLASSVAQLDHDAKVGDHPEKHYPQSKEAAHMTVELHNDGSGTMQVQQQKHQIQVDHDLDKIHSRSVLLRRESGKSSEKLPGSEHTPGLLDLASQIKRTEPDAEESPKDNDAEGLTDARIGTDSSGTYTDLRNGVCQQTDGVLTHNNHLVAVVKDLTDCGSDVKEVKDTIPDTEVPLSYCAQLVEDDPECGRTFMLQDEVWTCSCVKGDAVCPKADNNATCTYEFVAPVCANTTGIETHANDEIKAVAAVYASQWVAGCDTVLTLSGTFDAGLEACANAVANNPECGTLFQMHRETFACKCMKPGATCDYEDSGEICQYELFDPLE